MKKCQISPVAPMFSAVSGVVFPSLFHRPHCYLWIWRAGKTPYFLFWLRNSWFSTRTPARWRQWIAHGRNEAYQGTVQNCDGVISFAIELRRVNLCFLCNAAPVWCVLLPLFRTVRQKEFTHGPEQSFETKIKRLLCRKSKYNSSALRGSWLAGVPALTSSHVRLAEIQLESSRHVVATPRDGRRAGAFLAGRVLAFARVVENAVPRGRAAQRRG